MYNFKILHKFVFQKTKQLIKIFQSEHPAQFQKVNNKQTFIYLNTKVNTMRLSHSVKLRHCIGKQMSECQP